MIPNNQLPKTISIRDKDSEIPFLRIAVSNYVWTTNGELLSILTKTRSSTGIPSLGLIGGGAHLMGNEKERLAKLGAFDFEGKDARFKIPLEAFSDFVDSNGNPKFWCEQDISREIAEELSSEVIGEMTEPIITYDEVRSLNHSYLGCFSMFQGDSLDAIQRGTNFRIIYLFGVEGPEEIVSQIKQSPIISLITKSDILNGYSGPDQIGLKSSIGKALEYMDSMGSILK